jgi:hypothetical protein
LVKWEALRERFGRPPVRPRPARRGLRPIDFEIASRLDTQARIEPAPARTKALAESR